MTSRSSLLLTEHREEPEDSGPDHADEHQAHEGCRGVNGHQARIGCRDERETDHEHQLDDAHCLPTLVIGRAVMHEGKEGCAGDERAGPVHHERQHRQRPAEWRAGVAA